MTKKAEKVINFDEFRVEGAELEKLQRLQKVEGKRVAPAPRPGKWRRGFVRVPWLWVETMKDVENGAPYRLAMFILYEHWKGDGRPVRISNVAVAAIGIGQDKKRRALQALERLGLVTVERKARQAPLVTPRFPSN
jgi:hypothetical protein